ncbi:MAG TPA: mobile mystery protein B [Planctomycetes bacterium]|nr:mobile mystery protein B [Planctomycetota bacterium]
MIKGFEPIEGETSIEDVSGLKIKSVTNRKELAEVEFKNIAKALLKYLAAKPSRRIAPFHFSWVLKLHEEMFCDVWDWAGKVRDKELTLGVAPEQIRGLLQSLVKDIPEWQEYGMDIQEQAAYVHMRAVKIHPFLNGNGRWSRLLANIHLRINDAPLTTWPERTIGEESEVREDYIAAVKRAVAGNVSSLYELHLKYKEVNTD